MSGQTFISIETTDESWFLPTKLVLTGTVTLLQQMGPTYESDSIAPSFSSRSSFRIISSLVTSPKAVEENNGMRLVTFYAEAWKWLNMHFAVLFVTLAISQVCFFLDTGKSAMAISFCNKRK